jgi:hypothetical protein
LVARVCVCAAAGAPAHGIWKAGKFTCRRGRGPIRGRRSCSAAVIQARPGRAGWGRGRRVKDGGTRGASCHARRGGGGARGGEGRSMLLGREGRQGPRGRPHGCSGAGAGGLGWQSNSQLPNGRDKEGRGLDRKESPTHPRDSAPGTKLGAARRPLARGRAGGAAAGSPARAPPAPLQAPAAGEGRARAGARLGHRRSLRARNSSAA